MSSSIDHARDPCPWRVLEDAGGAFAMGAIGGGIWNTWSGFKNSPRGYRLSGAIQGVKNRAPVIGGNFAIWGMSFSTIDCILIFMRGREDAYNSIISGAATGAFLSARGGFGAMVINGFFGGAFLAIIEGAGVVMNRLFAEEFRPRTSAPPA